MTEAKKHGVIAVLAKPVDANTLHAAVQEALRYDQVKPVGD